MPNNKELLIHDKWLELFLRPVIWKQTQNNLLFVGPHSASGQTSAEQKLNLANLVVTSCVGLSLSSWIDTSVRGGGVCANVVCVHNHCRFLRWSWQEVVGWIWNVWEFQFSLEHTRLSFWQGKFWLCWFGCLVWWSYRLPPTHVDWRWICVIKSSSNWVAKCLASESDFLPSVTSFWTSLKFLLHSSFELLLCVSSAHFSCFVAFDCVDCCWIPAHVVAATTIISSRLAVAGWRFKVLEGQADCQFPGQISLKHFSEVGKSGARHAHSSLNHWKSNWSLAVLMIEWTGSCQMFECPMQKHVVLLLLCSLLECFSACTTALAVNVGMILHLERLGSAVVEFCSEAGFCLIPLLSSVWTFFCSWRDGFESCCGVDVVFVQVLQLLVWFKMCVQVCVGCPEKSSVQAWKKNPFLNGHLRVILSCWCLSSWLF